MQVAGFIRERELKVNEEEEGARSPDMLAALWGLLRLMALNEGRLRSSPSSASKTKPSPPLGDAPSHLCCSVPRLPSAFPATSPCPAAALQLRNREVLLYVVLVAGPVQHVGAVPARIMLTAQLPGLLCVPCSGG